MVKKVALVTGAAVGIGRAIGHRLARDGVAIGVLDLNLADAQKVAEEIKGAGGEAIGLKADIAQRSHVQAAAEALRAAFGPITVVVNNAGITGFKPFLELTDGHEPGDDRRRVVVVGRVRGHGIVSAHHGHNCAPRRRRRPRVHSGSRRADDE
jgi:NAD(P)-dependent dehydrogenase (short-subunit alcohol dehydrogenase family)